jgi:crotonobetainyl-CoA:carnitine CoA-transferase CaiB-like acyl-CoA transferase
MVVNTPDMLLTDPQLTASGFWQYVEHPTEGRLRMCDPPIRFANTPSTIRQLPPHLGEHSIAVLQEAGYSSDEIETMIAAGVTKIPEEVPEQ